MRTTPIFAQPHTIERTMSPTGLSTVMFAEEEEENKLMFSI